MFENLAPSLYMIQQMIEGFVYVVESDDGTEKNLVGTPNNNIIHARITKKKILFNQT